MKSFHIFFVMSVLMAFVYGCNPDEGQVSTDVTPYKEITPTYPDGGGDGVDLGGDSSGTDGGSSGGSDGTDGGGSDGTDTSFDPNVMLKIVGAKYCSWTAASQNALCIRTEEDIEDPNAKTICWGSPNRGITAVPRFEKDDSRYGADSGAVGLTDISSIFANRPQQMDGNYWHITAGLKGGKGDAWGTDATVNASVGSMSGHLSTGEGSPLQTIDNLSIMKSVAGYKHSHFLLSDGSLTGVGTGSSGQLGVDDTFRVINLNTFFAPNSEAGEKWYDVRDVAAGSFHSVLIRGEYEKPGVVWITGKNTDGQHGNFEHDDDSTQETAYDTIAVWQETSITDAVQVAAGSNATCVLHVDGSVSCAGAGRNGIIANGDEAQATLKHPFTKITHIINESGNLQTMPPMKFITMGNAVAYAIDHRGNLYGWGSNSKGQTGVNRPDLDYITRPRPTGLQNVTDVAIHNTTAIARVGEGTNARFYAVGRNSHGQVFGDPTKATSGPVHEWQEIDLSNVITPDPDMPDPETETVAPPTNLSSTETTDNSTRINWVGDESVHDYYNLSICADPAGGCVLDNTTGYVQSGDWRYIVSTLRTQTIGVSGVQPGSAVRVRLQAVSFLGNRSAWTDELVVEIPMTSM